MTTEITFILRTTLGNRDDVLSTIQGIPGLELSTVNENTNGPIVCTKSLPNDKSESAATTCSEMCNLDNVESVRIFVNTTPDIEIETPHKIIPFIPMIVSSIVTFFTIYGVLVSLGKSNAFWDIVNYGIFPSFVIFMIQLGSMTQDYWIKIFRKKKKNS